MLRKFDPRIKLLTGFGFSLLVSVTHQYETACLAVGMGLISLAVSGLRLGHVLARAGVVNFFVLFLWFFLPWSWQGLGYWPTWNQSGAELAWLITLKVNAIFGVILALLGTSSINELLHALNHLYIPKKLVMLFMLFHRYTYLLKDESFRLQQAMKARCFRPGSNMHTWRTFANLAGMLLVRAYDRAERVHQAMICRGFNGTFWILDHFSWHRRDSAFTFCATLALSLLAFLELRGVLWS